MLAAQKWCTGACVSSSGKDPLSPVTTVSFPAGQFNSRQLSFVDFGDVPIADINADQLVARQQSFKRTRVRPRMPS
jgi:hypothetical protein